MHSHSSCLFDIAHPLLVDFNLCKSASSANLYGDVGDMDKL